MVSWHFFQAVKSTPSYLTPSSFSLYYVCVPFKYCNFVCVTYILQRNPHLYSCSPLSLECAVFTCDNDTDSPLDCSFSLKEAFDEIQGVSIARVAWLSHIYFFGRIKIILKHDLKWHVPLLVCKKCLFSNLR